VSQFGGKVWQFEVMDCTLSCSLPFVVTPKGFVPFLKLEILLPICAQKAAGWRSSYNYHTLFSRNCASKFWAHPRNRTAFGYSSVRPFCTSTQTLLRPKPYFDFSGQTLLRPKLYFDLCFSPNKNFRFRKEEEVEVSESK